MDLKDNVNRIRDIKTKDNQDYKIGDSRRQL